MREQQESERFMAVQLRAFFLTALLSLVCADRARADFKGNLVIEVDRLNNQKGEVCFKLFSGSQGFPYGNESAIKRQCVGITDDSLTIALKDIPSGSYAVSIFHDLNGDRKLNRNSLGMPTEGYGFSNNPVVRSAPPNYGDCIFVLAGNTSIKITMKYSGGD